MPSSGPRAPRRRSRSRSASARARWSLAALIAAAACSAGAPADDPDGRSSIDAAPDAVPDAALPIDAAPPLDAADANLIGCPDPGGVLVFLNRGGGVYHRGPDDPGANQSSVVTGTHTIAPYAVPDATWAAIRSCVAGLVAPFHLRVTDVDPGAVDHVEVVLTEATSIRITGVAETLEVSPLTCRLYPSSVHFAFVGGASVDRACRLAAKAIGKAAGIDDTIDCVDTVAGRLGYPGCAGAEGYTDAERTCGVSRAVPCRCDPARGTRNSLAIMKAVYGHCPSTGT